MKITDTFIPGLKIIEPVAYIDSRGYFLETYNEKAFRQNGIDYTFVQDNESKSSYGVIRGLHYQLTPYAQTKLVRVLKGSVLDVAVDIRKGSPTFGKWFSLELNEDNRLQLLIPHGFAHGFSVLSESCIFIYKCNAIYNREAERGVHYNDPILAIDWRIQGNKAVVSDKDQQLPLFNNAEINFTY